MEQQIKEAIGLGSPQLQLEPEPMLHVKEKLQALLYEIRPHRDSSPITNLKLDKITAAEIEQLTMELERINPNPNFLLDAIDLLEGAWQLQYSTAREICSLDSLSLGFKLGKVYQLIDVSNKSFLNLAYVKHNLGILSGYVKVTATFEPATADLWPLASKRINIYFDKYYRAIEKIIGIETPQLNPFKVVSVNNSLGRVDTLDITYLDENLRISRAGNGSLFILRKISDLPE